MIRSRRATTATIAAVVIHAMESIIHLLTVRRNEIDPREFRQGVLIRDRFRSVFRLQKGKVCAQMGLFNLFDVELLVSTFKRFCSVGVPLFPLVSTPS